MSMVMNNIVKTCYKAVTANLFTVVGLLVEPNKDISKQKSFI